MYINKLFSIFIMSLLLFFSNHSNADQSINLSSSEEFSQQRDSLVTDLKKYGIKDPDVLAAINKIPRENFVRAEDQGQAYSNKPLPIAAGQTISQPYIVAGMTQLLLQGKKMQRVLEIGTGSGYQAAILSCVVPQVYSVERIKQLHETAAQALHQLGINNVALYYGDGFNGWEEYAPYDGIIVTAAFDEVPPALLQQLKDGGRLVMPVKTNKGQVLKLVIRHGKKFTTQIVGYVDFVPMLQGVNDGEKLPTSVNSHL